MQVQVTDIKNRDISSENFTDRNTEQIFVILLENLKAV